MAPVNDLSKLDVDEVSPVRRGAIGRIWSFLKADDDGSVEMEADVVKALGTPLDDEASVVDALKADGLDGAGLEAAVATKRLAAFVAKAKSMMTSADEDLEGCAASAEGDQDGDEDDGATGGTDDDGDADNDAMPTPDEMRKEVEIYKRDINTADRKRLAAEGKALPDGSYPIENADDLKNAATLAESGHGDVAAAKALIARRAKALGVPNPLTKSADDLGGVTKHDKENGMGDALNAPVQKEDGTWDTSGVTDPAQRSFYDSVLKSLDDAKSEADTLRDSITKAEEKRAELEGKLVEKELIQKAESEMSHVAKADELVPVLKAAKESLDADTFEKLDGLLKSANAKIEAGALFAELGRSMDPVLKAAMAKGEHFASGGGDAWDKIVEKAEATIVAKDGEDLSIDQKVDRFLKTAEGKRLYAEYRAENGAVA